MFKPGHGFLRLQHQSGVETRISVICNKLIISSQDPTELDDEFDIHITGPWFDKYHIVKHSIHVDQYQKEKKTKEETR